MLARRRRRPPETCVQLSYLCLQGCIPLGESWRAPLQPQWHTIVKEERDGKDVEWEWER